MSKIIKRLIVLVFILNYGVAQDIQSRMTMELLNAYENGGGVIRSHLNAVFHHVGGE